MKCLYVLYDQECSLCLSCGRWLMRQAAFIQLRFIPLQSPRSPSDFRDSRSGTGLDLREKLVVVSDEGAVYQGQYAWIMCLLPCAIIANGRRGWPSLGCFPLRVGSASWFPRIGWRLAGFLPLQRKNFETRSLATLPSVCGVGTNFN